MCGTNDLQLDSCYKQKHEDTSAPTHSCSSSRSNSNSEGNSSVEKVWKETQQLMEDCEQLVRIMTHVCSQQFSGAYRTSLARYSQGCWLGCSSEESGGECGRCCATASHHHNVNSSHSTSSSWRHPSCSPPSSPSQMLSGCKGGCHSCGGCGESCCSAAHNPRPCNNHHHQEETTTPSPPASSSCRWRGWRWRRRWGRCQSDQCHKGGCCCSCCCCCSSVTTTTPSTTTMGLNSGVCRLGPLPPSTTTSSSYSQLPSSSSTTTVDLSTSITTTTAYTSTNPCPTLRASEGCCPTTRDVAAHPTRVHTPRARLVTQGPSQARATPAATTTASPKPRGGSPAHPSLLTILLLLVVTLARFTDGCSSRSTPKPRPASPTMRPNITFQTYACPPAYAAWYCLNGATCFTVKIGESILYNCECADGYMGQRCEFKDLDGSYLPAREKVLLETASIAGGATVACVLVFMVLFAVYIFMQKDKDKRCRDLDEQHNDRQPFSGYQNPRPEMFRTISNPYARTFEELSHVEVESAGHDTASSGGRNGSGSTGGGNLLDSNLHSSQHSATPQPS